MTCFLSGNWAVGSFFRVLPTKNHYCLPLFGLLVRACFFGGGWSGEAPPGSSFHFYLFDENKLKLGVLMFKRYNMPLKMLQTSLTKGKPYFIISIQCKIIALITV